MRLRLPRALPLILLSLALSGSFAALAGALGLPDVTPAQAARFEGQGDVRMEGLADSLHRSATGWDAQMHWNGTMLALRGQGEPGFKDGTWVRAEGRIARSQGRLALFADSVIPTPDSAPWAAPSWSGLAQDPGQWDHRLLRLSGWLDHGDLRDHEGHSLRLAVGAWGTGPATIEGYLAYDAGCFCHRLHGQVVAAPA